MKLFKHRTELYSSYDKFCENRFKLVVYTLHSCEDKTVNTRIHPSRIRTALLLTISRSIPCISGGGLPNPPPTIGRPPPPGFRPPWMQTPPGCRRPWSCYLECMLGSQSPHLVDRQTPVKILPCPNFVCGR